MKIKEISSHFEAIAPSSLQESYDNSGLQVGDAEWDIDNALICVDCTEDVVNEAIQNNCGLVISRVLFCSRQAFVQWAVPYRLP